MTMEPTTKRSLAIIVIEKLWSDSVSREDMWRTRAAGVARGGGGGSVSRVLTRVGRPRQSRHPSCTVVFVTMSYVIPQLETT